MNRKAILAILAALILAMLLTVPIGAQELAEAATEAAETTPEAGPEWWAFWENIDVDGLRMWFEAEVLPHLASVSMILGVALVEIIPAVRGLIKAKGAFQKVAADVDAYNQSKIEYDLRVEEREKEFEARIEKLQEEHNKQIEEFNKIAKQFEEKLAESEKVLEGHLLNVENNATKVERMCYLAFTNSGELVTNGVARRVAEVNSCGTWEDDDARDDVETEEYSDGE